MSDKNSLSQLTKSLMVGASAGTLVLVQVGCAPVAQQTPTEQGGGQTISVPASQRAACERVLATKTAADMNALMQAFPSSKCILPLLNILPARSIAGLSPEALSGLAPSIQQQLPDRVTSRFTRTRVQPVRTRTQTNTSPFPEEDDGDDGPY